MNAFISYKNENIEYTKAIKKFLNSISIDTFIAHDDLRNGSDWKDSINTNLLKSDIFVPLLSKGFKESDWCSQEIGIAFSHGIKIIPISLDGTRSYGFIQNLQSISITERDIPLLLTDGLLVHYFEYGVKGIIELLKYGVSFYFSEQVYALIEPYYDQLEYDDLNNICKYSIENNQVWLAGKCTQRYIPKLLENRKNDIDIILYTKLKYQIANKEWYKEG